MLREREIPAILIYNLTASQKRYALDFKREMKNNLIKLQLENVSPCIKINKLEIITNL